MCILFSYSTENPPQNGYRLIIASNRDEYYHRPAQPAFFCPRTGILGGRDMEPGREGGMWLGAGVRGGKFKFGALLNVTGAEKRPATRGRGPLVYDYLRADAGAAAYAAALPDDFSSFNLVMLELERGGGAGAGGGWHFSNAPRGLHAFGAEAVLAFGNSTPGAPLAKVTAGRRRFEAIARAGGARDGVVRALTALLKCRAANWPDAELERRAPGRGAALSSVFVEVDGVYGTRTHSIVLVDADYNVEFIESTMREPIDLGAVGWVRTEIAVEI